MWNRTQACEPGRHFLLLLEVVNSLPQQRDPLERKEREGEGPYIKDVRKIFGFLDPPPPLVRKFTQPPLLISSTMSAFGVPPSPPPGADVLYVWPLAGH